MSMGGMPLQSDPPSPLRLSIHFFALALGFTWALQFPGVLAQAGLLPGDPQGYMPLVVLGVFGPLVAAWFLTHRAEGRKGVRNLFRSLYTPRPGLLWMLGALAAPGVLLSLGLAVKSLILGPGPLAYLPDSVGRVAAGLLISVGEEVGWRGYALPKLSLAVGRVRASLIIGVVWTVWHLPMFLGQGVPLDLLPIMFVYFMGGSVAFSWFYFKTRGSLLIAVLLHLGAHLNSAHASLPGDIGPLLVHTIGWVLVAVGLVAFDRKVWRS